jgi:hypothetical protein
MNLRTRIEQLFHQGLSTLEIAKVLNQEGYKSRSGGPIKGPLVAKSNL